MQAGLRVGGALKANASNGDTDVHVNGRRLPRAELYALQQLVGPVRPGYYWLDPYGNAGLEGGPALVNLAQARARSQGGGYAGWNNNTAFGNWGGDSNCSYYNSPNGDSVMVGDGCWPARSRSPRRRRNPLPIRRGATLHASPASNA